MEPRASPGEGWHPWYEVKTDPERRENVVVCGTKWDARSNSLFGFVYASTDMGLTWRSVLEDRHSAWVSEQSCAFGPHHWAYFVSEASKIVAGRAHHALGTTRLYISKDGGRHWESALETAWADFSTSAVSVPSGKLYTFYNAAHNLGLLVFPPDGKSVSGPFVNPAIRGHYRAVYPYDAISMRDGAVVALYQGIAHNNRESDLGVVRADSSMQPALQNTVISHSVLDSHCAGYDHGSLTYDAERGRLFVLYGDGCKWRALRLTWSDDEGKTWAKSATVLESQTREVVAPSLIASSGGSLGLMWEDGLPPSGRWLFSTIRDESLLRPPVELSKGHLEPPISRKIPGSLNEIWKINGLVEVGGKVLAIWPSGDERGMRLHSALVE